jgi:hypothetical protein
MYPADKMKTSENGQKIKPPTKKSEEPGKDDKKKEEAPEEAEKKQEAPSDTKSTFSDAV